MINTPWRPAAVGSGLVQPRVAALGQPPLQILQPAHIVEFDVHGHELQHAGLADGLTLLLQNDVDIFDAQHPVAHHRPRERVLRVGQREPERSLHQPLSPDIIDGHPDPATRSVRGDHPVQQDTDLGLTRQREVEQGHVLLKVGRDPQHRRHQNERARYVAGLESGRDVTQAAHDRRVGRTLTVTQHRVQVPEHEHRRLAASHDRIQRRRGTLRTRSDRPIRRDQALGGRPRHHRPRRPQLTSVTGNCGDLSDGPLLLKRLHVENGEPR